MGKLLVDKLRAICAEKEEKGQLWYAFYFAVMIALQFNPMADERNRVVHFKRLIGAGIIQNVDVARRTSNFSCWFILFIISFVIIYLLAGYFLTKKYSKEEEKVIQFLNHFLVIANIDVVLLCINYFQNEAGESRVFQYSANLILGIVCAALIYVLARFGRFITSERYFMLFIVAFSMGYGITAMMNQRWDSGKLLYVVQMTLFCITVIGYWLVKKFLKLIPEDSAFKMFVIISSFLPLITSFYIELIHILNQWGVYVVRVRRYYMLAVGLVILIAIAFSGLACKKQRTLTNWKRIAYPVLIFGVSCLAVQVPLEAQYGAEMYESANYSVLISDFLNYGTVPLVEHYGGHMMTGVWEGLIYAVLNHDRNGAILSPYMVYITPVLAVLFFYLVKNLWDEDMAFMTVMFLPFYDSWSYYGLGMLVCLAVMAFTKQNTYLRAVVIWLAVIWCALYRLDLGAAFGVAAILALLIYVLQNKKWKAAQQLAITLGVCGISGILLWCIICMKKGINAYDRLKEFLLISFSNGNWAYDNIGSVGNMAYFWCYLFIPFLCAVCLVFTVFSGKIKKNVSLNQWMILLIMGFSYFTNYSRGLVRHSLAETSTLIVIIWSGYIFLAAFFSCFKKNKRVFIITFMGIVVSSSLLMWNANFEEKSLLDKEVAVTGKFTDSWKFAVSEEKQQTYWQELEEKGMPAERVQWTEDLEEQVKPYRIILGTLLKEDETFIDFMNKTFLYSALNRRNPVYVSQSPMQLSGEEAQELFIKEIEGVPLVLMPLENNEYDRSDSLDGIPNTYRYYKVSEYIYQNYVPLCRYTNKFAIWCLPQRFDEMNRKLAELMDDHTDQTLAEIVESIYTIDYGYDGPSQNEDDSYTYLGVFHSIPISYLPEIWADCDEKEASGNPIVARMSEKEENVFCMNEEFQTDSRGNYLLLHITSNCEMESTIVKIGKYENGVFDERYRYLFTVSEGTHDYLIRVSTDYYWYAEALNAVCIQSDAELSDMSMCILEGD